MTRSAPTGRRPKAIAFDLDGLLVDTEPIYRSCVRLMLARRGLACDESVFEAMLGRSAPQALSVLRSRYALAESIDTLRVEATQSFFDVLDGSPARLMHGVLEILARVDGFGIPRAVATSSSRRYLQRILEPHGLLEGFGFSLTGDDVGEGKPSPEIYLKAARHFGVEPEEMVVLEDSPAGLQAAKSAGARCVVVPHDLIPRHAIGVADLVASSLAAAELMRFLGF